MADQVKFNKLKDAKVLIVGGSSGIGYGVAEAVVEQGAHVFIASSSSSRVQAAVESLSKAYPSASSRINGFATDLSDPATTEDNVRALLEKTGELDHIVFTAASGLALMPYTDVTAESIIKAGQFRFVAPLLLAKHSEKYLKKSHRSSFTLTSGTVAEKPMDGWTVTNAYATGIQGLARGLALELKPIRVNVVQPGFVKTPLWTATGMDEATVDKTIAEAAAKLPVGRAGAVEDVAEAYLFSMRDGNANGALINTNGGALLI